MANSRAIPRAQDCKSKADGTLCCGSQCLERDEDLAIDLLRKMGVIVHPGHFYDFPNEGHLVLSLITEPATFREGVARLLQVVGA